MPRLALLFAIPLFLGCTTTEEEPARIGSLTLQFTCGDLVPENLADRVGCTTIEVPQLHADPSGPKLTLRVFGSIAPDTRGREPIVYLTGGPGISVRGLATGGFTAYFAGALDRDVILIEQRGNTLSRPALDCKLEPSEAWDERLRQCVGDARTEGTLLEAFNTIESAHDIDDLRRAIGVEKVVLWGASYGSLLAGAFAREHPDNVAGLVLEASVLGDRPYRAFERDGILPQKVTAFTSWLKASCATNTACHEQYPDFDPDAELNALLERIKIAPVALSEKLVIDSPATLENLLFAAMYTTPIAVLLLRAIWASNHTRLSPFAEVWIDGEPAPAYLERALQLSSVSSTTNIIVNCYDTMRQYTDEGIAKLFPAEQRANALQSAAEVRGICSALPPPSVDSSRFIAPVGSTAPTLFLGGRLDPVTPIEWAIEDAARFPNSHVFTAECMGHGVVFGAYECFGSLLKTFVDHLGLPGAPVFDSSCIERRCRASEVTADLLLEEAR